MIPRPHTTVIINAGGQSRRMGQAKALLPVPPDQRPLLARIAQSLAPLADEMAVIAQDPAICAVAESLGLTCHGDRRAGLGPLGGLYTALPLVQEWLIWVACDLPLIQPDLVRSLQALAQSPERDAGDDPPVWDAIVPRVGGRPEPLLALYHRRCLAAVEEQIRADRLRMTDLLAQLRTHYVEEDYLRQADPDLRSFTNVNTPEEWQQALDQWGRD